MSKHHGGTLEKSNRLKMTLKLCQGRGHTNWEIRAKTDSAAVHSDCDDLRKLGYLIDCSYEGLSENGRKIYRYQQV